MKKRLFLVLLFLLILSSLFKGAGYAKAWDDCPFGKVNDEYPGDCPRFVDTDKDGICDHSQPPPEERIVVSESETLPKEISQPKSEESKTNYYLGFVSFFIFALYFLTYFFSKKKIIKVLSHRKLWNFFLTIAFLINLFTSALLVSQLSFNLQLNLPFNLSFWHVETGIVFSLIALLHILWHLPYYKQFLKLPL